MCSADVEGAAESSLAVDHFSARLRLHARAKTLLANLLDAAGSSGIVHERPFREAMGDR